MDRIAEFEIFSDYIYRYGNGTEKGVNGIIDSWQTGKSQYLHTLMDGKTILEQPVSFDIDEQEKQSNFRKVLKSFQPLFSRIK